MPNVIGLTKEEAKKKLSSYAIEYTGFGNYVISQSPEAGETLEKGSIIRIMLGNLT